MITFERPLSEKKDQLLAYFRQRAAEALEEIRTTYGVKQIKERATAINREIIQTEGLLVRNLLQEAEARDWEHSAVLDSVLMLQHVRNVVMLESRNDVWPYDYMAFSRRIGELWEPFCKLCFDYPSNDLKLFVPPLFSEVRRKLRRDIETYIDQLNITPEQKEELNRHYDKVWSLVVSGEIKLQLDLHFTRGGENFNVDFKSGFGSNEKGNTNRLLMVATIYKNLEQNFRCLILVRSKEDQNNAYFRTLKNSGVWDAYCGDDAYEQIAIYSGFDLKAWIDRNIRWEQDFKRETFEYLEEKGLTRYLSW